MNIDQFVKEAQARCDAATKGPWKLEAYSNLEGASVSAQWFGCVAERWWEIGAPRAEGWVVATRKNFEFIANARQDLPAALEIIASLRARVAVLEAALEKITTWLEREIPPQYAGVDREGLPIEIQPTSAEATCGMAAMVCREALKGKS